MKYIKYFETFEDSLIYHKNEYILAKTREDTHEEIFIIKEIHGSFLICTYLKNKTWNKGINYNDVIRKLTKEEVEILIRSNKYNI